MRAARLVACTAAVAAFALAPAASGAARACNLVVDPKGDASHGSDPALDGYLVSTDLDVVGADLASNKRYVTAVVRLVTLRASDPDAPTGRSYEVAFTVDRRHYAMTANYGPDGYSGSADDVDLGVGLGSAGVVLDHAKREVRITAPVSYFGVENGKEISGLAVTTGSRIGTNTGRGVSVVPAYGVWVGGAGLRHRLDTASSDRTYVAGSPSCVAVAR